MKKFFLFIFLSFSLTIFAQNNTSSVLQSGDGHDALVNQINFNNKAVTNQIGSGHTSSITETGLTKANRGSIEAEVNQTGTAHNSSVNSTLDNRGKNLITVDQNGLAQFSYITQIANNVTADVDQFGGNNLSTIEQYGYGDKAKVYQSGVLPASYGFRPASIQFNNIAKIVTDEAYFIIKPSYSYIEQIGSKNEAEIRSHAFLLIGSNENTVSQHGNYNFAKISNVGMYNDLNIEQSQNYNNAEITNKASRSDADILQTGSNNEAYQTIGANCDVDICNTNLIEQNTDNNFASSTQMGSFNNSIIHQFGGNGNSATVTQNGFHNISTVNQNGSSNIALVTQK